MSEDIAVCEASSDGVYYCYVDEFHGNSVDRNGIYRLFS
jgi:hypothetical protein